MAEDFYVGDKAKLNFTFDNSKMDKKTEILIEIYEIGHEADILFSESREIPANKKQDIKIEWTVIYKGEEVNLKDGNSVEYAFRVTDKKNNVVSSEAKMNIKAHFYKLKFQYKDPEDVDVYMPDGVRVDVMKMLSDSTVKIHKTYTLENGDGTLDFIKNDSSLKGIRFDMRFDPNVLNLTENIFMLDASVKLKIEENPEYLKENRLAPFLPSIDLNKDSWHVSSDYNDTDNIITEADKEITVTLKPGWNSLTFQYKDWDDNAVNVPPGIVLEAILQKQVGANLVEKPLKLYTAKDGKLLIAPAGMTHYTFTWKMGDKHILNLTAGEFLTDEELKIKGEENENYKKENLLLNLPADIPFSKKSFSLSADAAYEEVGGLPRLKTDTNSLTLTLYFIKLQLEYQYPKDSVTMQENLFPVAKEIDFIFRSKDAAGAYVERPEIIPTGPEGKILLFPGDVEDYRFELKSEFSAPPDIKLTYLNITDNAFVVFTEDEFKEKVLKENFSKDKLWFTLPAILPLDGKVWESDPNNSIIEDAATHVFYLDVTKAKLKLRFKPEWIFVKFQYTDKAGNEIPVPEPLLVLDIYKKAPELFLNRTNIFVTDKKLFMLPMIEQNTRHGEDFRINKNMVYKFETPEGLYIRNNSFEQMKAGGTCTKEPKKKVREMDITDRLTYFDLPRKWESKAWGVNWGGNDRIFEDILDELTTDAAPFIFHLDAVVLTDALFAVLAWPAVGLRRFTVFDIEMNYVNPDVNQALDMDNRGFWNSKVDQDRNFFMPSTLYDSTGGAKKTVRAISLNGQFYDVTDERSESGDVIGARAAVLLDPRVHAMEARNNNQLSLNNNTGNTQIGNHELHFFSGCLDGAGNERFMLIIYWSATFQPHAASPDRNPPLLEGGITPVQWVTKFLAFGMYNTKIRWENKDLKFKKNGWSGSNLPAGYKFHFEGREVAPNRCSIEIFEEDDEASYMIFNTGVYYKKSYLPEDLLNGAGLPVAGSESIAVVADTMGSFVQAHEQGHGCGLDDEYIYRTQSRIGGIPGCPRFIQYYQGMPYSVDETSMMYHNREIRLRHFWDHCDWMNTNNSVKGLTKKTKFKIEFIDGPRTFEFFLDKSDNAAYPCNKALYEPDKAEVDIVERNGKIDLFLYDIGDDETGDLLRVNGVAGLHFNSILAVRSKIQWRFVPNPITGLTWTAPVGTPIPAWVPVGSHGIYRDHVFRKEFIENFQANIVKGNFEGTFYFQKTGAKRFSNVYVYFFASHHYENIDGNPADEHFEVTVIRDSNQAVTVTGPGQLSVGENYNGNQLFKYVIGLNHNTAAVSPNDFKYMRKWVGGCYNTVT